jgi:hypothetical protein
MYLLSKISHNNIAISSGCLVVSYCSSSSFVSSVEAFGYDSEEKKTLTIFTNYGQFFSK